MFDSLYCRLFFNTLYAHQLLISGGCLHKQEVFIVLIFASCYAPCVIGTCTPTTSPSYPDGIDNDCDGKTDEDICTHTTSQGGKNRLLFCISFHLGVISY